jgi:phosphate transport system substrate-binding protein
MNIINRSRSRTMISSMAIIAIVAVAKPAAAGDKLSGKVSVDGSSTVAPITTATAELFRAEQPKVRVTVGVSGTGGGFKKFLADRADLRTDISGASRPIKNEELSRAKEFGVEFVEIPVAIDGITVVTHPENEFCHHLTVEELKNIWKPGSIINNWKQVRAGFPDMPLRLYGPGADSGTFDYFTEVIVGESKASRSDYTASESDNILVQGVGGDKGSLGYFGFSYYEANKKRLNLLAIDGGGGPVKPSLDVIAGGTYKPLSRPLFLYVNVEALDRPEVNAFLDFFFDNAKKIVEHPRVNYVALSNDLYGVVRDRVKSRVTGAPASSAEQDVDLLKLYSK